MIERFENLTSGVTQIYKSIQKIKRCCMDPFGLKGTHVMCLHYLYECPDGLTASDLCGKCHEDKAGISRILSDLEHAELISYQDDGSAKKYRAVATLTKKGMDCAKKVTDLIVHATIVGGQGISQEEREVFYRILAKIADNLNKECQNIDSKATSSIS